VVRILSDIKTNPLTPENLPSWISTVECNAETPTSHFASDEYCWCYRAWIFGKYCSYPASFYSLPLILFLFFTAYTHKYTQNNVKMLVLAKIYVNIVSNVLIK